MKKNIAVYPGTFDPPTYGHIDVIERAKRICQSLIIAVSDNRSKSTWFTVKERVRMMEKITKNMKGVTVDSFKELLVDYVEKKKANVVIRGIRALSDFEYEFQMALTNRAINPNVETVFMMPNESYSYLSSSLIKEIVSLGGNVEKFVPPVVEKELKSKCI